MNVDECIKTRRSVRRYKDKPVDWDKVGQILDAGKFAPSAGNIQNWKFVVVRKEAVRKKLAEASFDQEWMQDSPVHIVVVAEPDKAARFYGARGERLYTIQSCAAAVENMLLMANSLGLSSCWVGAFDERKVKRAVNMPESVVPQAIVVVGYSDEKPEMPARVELEHTVYLDGWGNKGQGWRAKDYKGVAIKDAINETKEALKRVMKNLTKE